MNARRSRLRLTEWEDLHKAQFLNAIDIVLTALSGHILRFARLAREMAQNEARDWRRAELLTLADNCDRIAHRPPQTFWQALQLCYFIQLTLQIESNGHSVSFGRLDQYLYPWYRRDVELEQNLTRENAIELLHSCWLKLLEVNKIRSGSHSRPPPAARCTRTSPSAGKTGRWPAVRRGQPAVLRHTRILRPPALHPAQPQRALPRRDERRFPRRLRAGDPLRLRHAGVQQRRNRHSRVHQAGVEPQDAYDYAAIGCIETAVGGKWGYRCTGMSFINFARVLLAALEQGRDATSGQIFLPQEQALSKGNFADFEQVMAAGSANPLLHAQVN